MSAERATPQHAYVQRFVNCPIYVHRKMGKKTDGTAACLNASLHLAGRRRALYFRVVDTRLRAQCHLPARSAARLYSLRRRRL